MEVTGQHTEGFLYIMSTDQYSKQNNFKIGYTDDLKSNLAIYNIGRPMQDLFKYCYYKKVFDGEKLNEMLENLLIDFKKDEETNSKIENSRDVISRFTFLRWVVNLIVENRDKPYDRLNDIIQNMAKFKTIEWLDIKPVITCNGETIKL